MLKGSLSFSGALLFDFEFCSLVEFRLVLGRQPRVKHARGVAADQFAILQKHPIGHILWCHAYALAKMNVTDFKRPVVDPTVEIFAVISDFARALPCGLSFRPAYRMSDI